MVTSIKAYTYSRFDLMRLLDIPAGLFFVLQRWKIDGAPPDLRKYVLIGAPHTSNWDFAYGIGVTSKYKLRFRWLAKDSLFKWPMGPIHRALGGIPVDRSRAGNLVEQIARAFHEADDLVLLIPPEGTRRKRDYWKSGFYYIALAAGVPVVLGYLDYEKKTVGFGPTLTLTGDVEADLAVIREFYEEKKGKFPEQTGDIRFRPHSESPAPGKR